MRIFMSALVVAAIAGGFIAGSSHANAVVITTESQIDPFLRHVYHDVLGRAPDKGGLASWHADLLGGMDTGAVALGFLTSPEYQGLALTPASSTIAEKTALVTGYYEKLLHREPEDAGLAGWVSGFSTPASVEAGFIGSAEYLNVSLTSGVPELSTWAMMIIGFGGVGLQMRRRDRAIGLSA